MKHALFVASASPLVVVVGVPECWVDARRLSRLLKRAAANDNHRRDPLAPEAQ